ncbi:MAG: type II toxin-antitoxin system Phd/YefM family antitoxin [Thermoanaerobaculia bacterium]|nr:type II toxin-antitoxin system Phd/YefM family antitoxin [Thermoanaerobaculia bacterium]
MTQVNIHEAKTHLSRLLGLVATGEEVVIAKAGKPVARLVAVTEPKPRRVLGQDAGLFEVPDDFDAPLPDDVLASFGL